MATWRGHLGSRSHMAAVELKKNPPEECQERGVPFPSWDHHDNIFSGRKHQSRLAKLQAERAVQLASLNRNEIRI